MAEITFRDLVDALGALMEVSGSQEKVRLEKVIMEKMEEILKKAK